MNENNNTESIQIMNVSEGNVSHEPEADVLTQEEVNEWIRIHWRDK